MFFSQIRQTAYKSWVSKILIPYCVRPVSRTSLRYIREGLVFHMLLTSTWQVFFAVASFVSVLSMLLRVYQGYRMIKSRLTGHLNGATSIVPLQQGVMSPRLADRMTSKHSDVRDLHAKTFEERIHRIRNYCRERLRHFPFEQRMRVAVCTASVRAPCVLCLGDETLVGAINHSTLGRKSGTETRVATQPCPGFFCLNARNSATSLLKRGNRSF
jgi:hypothetical protein